MSLTRYFLLWGRSWLWYLCCFLVQFHGLWVLVGLLSGCEYLVLVRKVVLESSCQGHREVGHTEFQRFRMCCQSELKSVVVKKSADAASHQFSLRHFLRWHFVEGVAKLVQIWGFEALELQGFLEALYCSTSFFCVSVSVHLGGRFSMFAPK